MLQTIGARVGSMNTTNMV